MIHNYVWPLIGLNECDEGGFSAFVIMIQNDYNSTAVFRTIISRNETGQNITTVNAVKIPMDNSFEKNASNGIGVFYETDQGKYLANLDITGKVLFKYDLASKI